MFVLVIFLQVKSEKDALPTACKPEEVTHGSVTIKVSAFNYALIHSYT